MIRLAAALPLLITATLAACGGDEGAQQDLDSAAPPPPSMEAPATEAPSTAPAGGGTGGEFVVSPEGAGEVRVGMTLTELAPHLAAGSDTTGIGDRCEYVRVREAPDSVLFMVEGGRVVRIDVTGGETPTKEGARVGDPSDRILQLYPTATRTPHKYTDGSYLTVVPGAPADSTYRYVFEVQDERVDRYRAGVYPQVEYVEGCS